MITRFFRGIGGAVERPLTREGVAAGRRGFIILQVDGLSYFVLRMALKQRLMPFLGRLIRRKGWTVNKIPAGLPATTPAIQLSMLYGRNDCVPGFRWFDRASQRFMIMKGVDDCFAIEQRASKGRRGILEGGASYATLFSGGAAKTAFTASRMTAERSEFHFAPFQILALLALNLGALFRIAGLSFVELWLELSDTVKVWRRGGLRRKALAFALVRIVSNVVLRELSTAMAVIDVYRGVPSIYVNYFGYDELSHHRGPHKLMTRLLLRGIDAQFRKVVNAARRAWPKGGYDVYVMSDHGQVPTIPFDYVYGQSFADFLSQRLLRMRVGSLAADENERRAGRTLSFINYLNSLQPVLPRWAAVFATWLARRLEHGLAPEVPATSAGELGGIYVLPTSDLAHIYFNDRPVRHTVEELEAEHPGAIASIVSHPGILLAAGLSSAGVVVFTREGTAVVDPETAALLSGPDPLGGIDAPPGLLRSLADLVQMADAGDLVVFARRKDMRVVDFQEELGGHGGPYPEEQGAFIVVPPDVQSSPARAGFDFGAANGPRDLYRLFSTYLGKETDS
ncbi:MAG: alkaline phosphatase family protein [Deltaproteobacteria bacterium]|nr:alkaline phosphatase family protein [Deltaproteobacteria bacterium]